MANLTSFYILILVFALVAVVLAVFLIRKNKKQQRLSVLAAVSFAFIIASITLSESRIMGYSLMGIGVALAVVDIIVKLKVKK